MIRIPRTIGNLEPGKGYDFDDHLLQTTTVEDYIRMGNSTERLTLSELLCLRKFIVHTHLLTFRTVRSKLGGVRRKM